MLKYWTPWLMIHGGGDSYAVALDPYCNWETIGE